MLKSVVLVTVVRQQLQQFVATASWPSLLSMIEESSSRARAGYRVLESDYPDTLYIDETSMLRAWRTDGIVQFQLGDFWNQLSKKHVENKSPSRPALTMTRNSTIPTKQT